MSSERLPYLFQQYRFNQCSPEELEELSVLCLLPQNQAILEQLAEQTWQEISIEKDMPSVTGEEILQRILKPSFTEELTEPGKLRRIGWKKLAVAASIIGVLFVAGYWLMNKETTNDGQQTTVVQTNDVKAPDKNRAQIKLSDGTIVYLDSAANGELVNTNGVVVTKTADGKIIYTTPSAVTTPTAVEYNTLMNPRGSKVQPLTLSDGTKVWLNAESSITYPTAFTGKERKVTMTGEAYFEVTKDAKKKFIVDANGTSTEVLGTHFNVNAYDDENNIKVTLLEGSVKVSSLRGTKQSILKPNQQAVIARNEAIYINSPDLDEVMSWRNGYFNFNQESITTIMRELGRWYNTEIVFSGEKPTDKFSAIIKRSNNISQVLKMLEKTNRVHFTIEGNTITVRN